jgi:hypothetical protein
VGAPAIFEKQIEITLLHSASTEEVMDSGRNYFAMFLVRLGIFGALFFYRVLISYRAITEFSVA